MRHSYTKEEKIQLLEELKELVLDVKNRDVNCYVLRFTSLFMDGSYSGYDQYQLNIRKYNRCASEKTRLQFCYQCMMYMLKIEIGNFVDNDLMMTMIEGHLNSEDIEWLNSELLERAYHTLSHDVM